MSQLPPALARALEARRLTVLCGAGVSMASPSCLPSWWGFNNMLLEEIKAKAAPRIPKSVRPAFDRLSLEMLRVEAFSDKVVRTFAGHSYFPVLEVLESDRPNACHAALAELSRRGILQAVLTSNFDTLIERAFLEAAVRLQVLADPRDAVEARPLPGVCTLVKVHGSVTATSSLVDTVSQKLRGLAPVVLARISELLRDSHLLVLGFSGADLSFREDYLALSRALEEGAGITWLYRPGSPLGPEAKRTVARAGERGAFVAGQLPDFFSLLGVEVASAALGGDPSADRQRAEEAARLRIRSWLEAPHIGETAAAVFCAALLEDRGERSAARAVLTALSAGAEEQAIPLTDGIVLRHRTIQALHDRNPDEARKWARRERAYFQGMERQIGEKMRPETRREILSGLAATAINEAAADRMAGDLEGARRGLGVARGLAIEADDLGLLARNAINEAELAELSGEGPEKVLTLARRARSRARSDGDVRSLLEGEILEARALTDLAEYDRALEAMERARRLADLEDAVMPRLEIRRAAADIELRRGRIEESYAERLAIVREVEGLGVPTQAAGLLGRLCVDFAFHPPLRDQILAHLDALQATAEESRPASAEAIRGFSASLRAGDFPPGPIPGLGQGRTWEERQRIALAQAEFAGRRAEIPALFLPLCQKAYGLPDRLFDLALGYQKAAERAGDREAGAEALNFVGVAQDLQGDFTVAAKTFQRALEAVPAWGTSLRARLWVHLALARSRGGITEGVEDLLERAERHFLELQDLDNAIRARMHLAEHRARCGDLDGAVQHGEVALARSRNVFNPGAQTMLEMLLRDWQRRQRVPEGSASEFLRSAVLSGYLEEVPLADQDLDEMRDLAVGPQMIANLGLAALQGGRITQAREFLHQALRIYREQEDFLGISRCLNNLANVAAAAENWDEAIDLSTRALELRRSLGDEEGEVRTLASLATFQTHTGRHSEALRSARIAVELSEASAPSRDRLVALIALTLAAWSLEKLDEAIPAARRALALFAVVRAPGLEPYLPLLREIAEAVPRAAPPLPVAGSEREELMKEAERLQRSSRFDESLELISELLGREDLLPEEKARLLGVRGNVLQSSGRDEEAVPVYEEAALLLRKTDQEELARSADQQRAVSLRLLGRAAESESILRDLLSRLVAGPERGRIVVSLVNVPLEMDEPGEARSERLREALRLVTESLEDPLLGDERRGLLEIQRGRLAAEAGDGPGARSALERARQLLLRSNSRYLQMAQMFLDEISGRPE